MHPYDANLISSENVYGLHHLVLDLDDEHWYSESSTKGHGHLVINKQLELSALKEIVHVLVKHNVLQAGIKKQLDDRGCLTLRMPGMKKGVKEDNMSYEELVEAGKEPSPVEEKTEPKYNSGGFITADINDFFKDFDITA